MKDVAYCDKPRGDVSHLRSGDFRMGQPGAGHAASLPDEYIVRLKRTEGTETSKYLQEEKPKGFPE